MYSCISDMLCDRIVLYAVFMLLCMGFLKIQYPIIDNSPQWLVFFILFFGQCSDRVTQTDTGCFFFVFFLETWSIGQIYSICFKDNTCCLPVSECLVNNINTLLTGFISQKFRCFGTTRGCCRSTNSKTQLAPCKYVPHNASKIVSFRQMNTLLLTEAYWVLAAIFQCPVD